MNASAYAQANRQKFLGELQEFLRIPSISAQPAHEHDIERAATWLSEQLSTAGFPKVAVMATAGLYETSGDWLFDVGLPGKSGVSGGIVTIAPGKGGMGTFAPRLDASGNSVKGQLTARYLSEQLGLNLFLSAPAE